MKVKEGFLLRSFGDDSVVVAVGEGSEDLTRDGLAEKVVDHYDIDKATAERDCDMFIQKLTDAGLIDA